MGTHISTYIDMSCWLTGGFAEKKPTAAEQRSAMLGATRRPRHTARRPPSAACRSMSSAVNCPLPAVRHGRPPPATHRLLYRTFISAARSASFRSIIFTSPKWKMEAARPASTSGMVLNRVIKSSIQPAPPEAMTGTVEISQTALSISRSKPPLTPSVSMLLRTISPAPREIPLRIHSMASMPVFSRPPLA